MIVASARAGYRGYAGSRAVRGTRFPQRVQNLVIRDYAMRLDLPFKLSLTEHAMDGSYMVLSDLLAQRHELEGVILFSLFMLPENQAQRRSIYDRFLDSGAVIHAALEEIVIRRAEDILAVEDLIAVVACLKDAPLAGRYEKGVASADSAFWQALLEHSGEPG